MSEQVFKFHNAMTASGLEYAAMSWNGFNLFGDRKSIDEAKRLLHEAGKVGQLQYLLREARAHGQSEDSK